MWLNFLEMKHSIVQQNGEIEYACAGCMYMYIWYVESGKRVNEVLHSPKLLLLLSSPLHAHPSEELLPLGES